MGCAIEKTKKKETTEKGQTEQTTPQTMPLSKQDSYSVASNPILRRRQLSKMQAQNGELKTPKLVMELRVDNHRSTL